jgi:hypothetical protein
MLQDMGRLVFVLTLLPCLMPIIPIPVEDTGHHFRIWDWLLGLTSDRRSHKIIASKICKAPVLNSASNYTPGR